MRYLSKCKAPFSLESLASEIRKSSNFQFEWEFYSFSGIDPYSPDGIRIGIDSIIESQELHQFLIDSMEYPSKFKIESLDSHVRVLKTNAFEDTLAQGAADHLGAYSQHLYGAKAEEKAAIKSLFEIPGDYIAYELLPCDMNNCSESHEHNNHCFSNWFNGVAWDWCFIVVWPKQKILWMGCLTDTD